MVITAASGDPNRVIALELCQRRDVSELGLALIELGLHPTAVLSTCQIASLLEPNLICPCLVCLDSGPGSAAASERNNASPPLTLKLRTVHRVSNAATTKFCKTKACVSLHSPHATLAKTPHTATPENRNRVTIYHNTIQKTKQTPLSLRNVKK